MTRAANSLFTLACFAFACHGAAAQACEVPPGYIAPQAPIVAPMEDLLSRAETVDVRLALQPVVNAVAALPMEDQVDPNSPLPRVVGTATLTQGDYGEPGSRRLVCLDDGSTMLQTVLDVESSGDSHVMRYQLWDYTSERSRAIDYSVGQFVYTMIGDDRTQVTWTQGFALKPDEIPGALGGIGRWLFRKNFLEEEYKTLMEGTLAHMKQTIEAGPGAQANAGE